jgi:hypothetical protein
MAMQRIRRKDLKPKREPTDKELLSRAQAAATRAANRAAREKRAEETRRQTPSP